MAADIADAERAIARLDRRAKARTNTERLKDVRAEAAAQLLLERLPEAPIVTAQGAANLIGRTFAAANSGIQKLVDMGVLVPTKNSARSRTFEAKEIIDAFTLLERQLPSLEGNTRVSRPIAR